jgi:hypothetical protein
MELEGNGDRWRKTLQQLLNSPSGNRAGESRIALDVCPNFLTVFMQNMVRTSKMLPNDAKQSRANARILECGLTQSTGREKRNHWRTAEPRN